MYRERASRLPGAFVWRAVVDTANPARRVLPDGCLDLICCDGTLLVAGPDTVAYLPAEAAGTNYTGLRFAPGTGPTVIGVPAYELRDQRVPLAEIWPAGDVRDLTERIREAADPGGVLEKIAVDRLRVAPQDQAIDEIVSRLRAGATVSATAQAVGLGARRLHRRCLAAFGYGPKTLVRILRMNRAVAMARTGVPFACVAADAGYADQAHLSREVKALAGVPLSTLVT